MRYCIFYLFAFNILLGFAQERGNVDPFAETNIPEEGTEAELLELEREEEIRETQQGNFIEYNQNNQNFSKSVPFETESKWGDNQQEIYDRQSSEIKSIDESQGLFRAAIKQIQNAQENIGQDKKTEDGTGKVEKTKIEVLKEKSDFAPQAITVDKLIEDNLEKFRFSDKRLRGPSQYDSRIEVRQLQPDIDWHWLILRRNESVGMLIEKERLQLVADSIYRIISPGKLGSVYNLCEQEPFKEQPVAGVGTAFITDTQSMTTAQHVFTRPLNQYAVVFGFELVNKNGIVELIIHGRDIYYPTTIEFGFDEYDTTIFKVDREINRPVLKWKTSTSLKEGDEIYMIGHPTGIPKKIALNASILDNSHPQYFYTSLDSFQGNSGSPVFDFTSHRVIGLLVSGQLDYNYNGHCNASTLCSPPYCEGEKVIRIERILSE